MYRLRVYPIPARGDVRIQIEYEQTLKSDNGTVEYLYPLNTEKYSGANLEECKVDIRLNSFENIGSLYCPTHPIGTERYSDKSMRALYQERNVRPDKDLIIYFTRQNRDFGFHILTYREPGSEDGFFLGILSPPLQSRLQNVAKNIIFILDSSGSMRGEKFSQVREALRFCLQGLNAGDNFNVIDYDDIVRNFRPALVKADKANIADAIAFTDRTEASGGTNIYEALTSACRMIPAADDPTYMIFLTDGQPTVGITDLEQITRNTSMLNEGRARLFVFGVGYDVNTHLLDRLAEENHGTPEYVLPDENIEVKVSRLGTKLSHPALTDMKLIFASMDTRHLYPSPLPDLFYGSEMIITGRYHGDGNSQAVISGRIGSKAVTYEFPVTFSDGSSRDGFIALLWANRRIAYLLQEMRLHGTNDEILSEIIDLSKKYGIITEYTSFLVSGDEYLTMQRRLGRPEGRVGGAVPDAAFMMPRESLQKDLRDNTNALRTEKSGKSAVGQAHSLGMQSQVVQLPTPNAVTVEGEQKQFNNVTQVGAQAFFQVGNNWVQGDLKDDKFNMQVKRFSKAYFQILEKDPSLGRYLGLGDEVRLRIGTQVVQIADSGKETLTDSDMSLLFPR
jgi:Ca-activated chloride channel family protein